MKDKMSFPQMFTDVVVSGLSAVLIIGTALSILWGWYVTRIFGIRAISFGEAYGLLLVVNAFSGGFGRLRAHIQLESNFKLLEQNISALCARSGFTAKTSPELEWHEKLLVRVGYLLLWSVLSLFIGWIIKLFI